MKKLLFALLTISFLFSIQSEGSVYAVGGFSQSMASAAGNGTVYDVVSDTDTNPKFGDAMSASYVVHIGVFPYQITVTIIPVTEDTGWIIVKSQSIYGMREIIFSYFMEKKKIDMMYIFAAAAAVVVFIIFFRRRRRRNK